MFTIQSCMTMIQMFQLTGEHWSTDVWLYIYLVWRHRPLNVGIPHRYFKLIGLNRSLNLTKTQPQPPTPTPGNNFLSAKSSPILIKLSETKSMNMTMTLTMTDHDQLADPDGSLFISKRINCISARTMSNLSDSSLSEGLITNSVQCFLQEVAGKNNLFNN